MSSSKPPYVHEPGGMPQIIKGEKAGDFFLIKFKSSILFPTKFHVAFLLIVGKPFDVNGTH
jgi:hypothetical protein